MTLRPKTMRPSLRAAALLLPLLLLVSVPSALAAGQFGIGVFGSYNSYDMEDVNNDIALINEGLDFLGFTTSMDEIENGMGYGGGLRYRSPGSLQFALDYERLIADTDWSEDDASIEVELPANAITATLTYLLASTSTLRYGFAGGLGYYSADGTLTLDDGATVDEVEIEGSDLGYHVGLVLDVGLSDQIYLNALAGWRQAKVDADDNDPATDDDGTIDYSGVTARVGLNFFFGMTGAE